MLMIPRIRIFINVASMITVPGEELPGRHTTRILEKRLFVRLRRELVESGVSYVLNKLCGNGAKRSK